MFPSVCDCRFLSSCSLLAIICWLPTVVDGDFQSLRPPSSPCYLNIAMLLFFFFVKSITQCFSLWLCEYCLLLSQAMESDSVHFSCIAWVSNCLTFSQLQFSLNHQLILFSASSCSVKHLSNAACTWANLPDSLSNTHKRTNTFFYRLIAFFPILPLSSWIFPSPLLCLISSCLLSWFPPSFEWSTSWSSFLRKDARKIQFLWLDWLINWYA